MRSRHLTPTVGTMLIAVAARSGAAAAQSDAEAGRSAPPVLLRFVNAPAGRAPLLEAPRLRIEIGGSSRKAVVDTGSTGVVLAASSIPGVDGLPTNGPGRLTYSSSGRVMVGRWVTTPLVISGTEGRVVTRPMPVLAVDAIECTAAARRCIPDPHPTGVAMLGIGFARERDHQPDGTPDHNPLLNLVSPAGARRSYVISRRGIEAGAGRAGFSTVQLATDPATGDWSAPTACVAIDAGQPSCGSLLVDTGVTGMFLTVPPERLAPGDRRSTSPSPGTRLRIHLLGQTTSSAETAYAFAVGDARDPAAPASVTLSSIGRRATFVNTGVRILNRFDYLYDADAGSIGFRASPTPAAGAAR